MKPKRRIIPVFVPHLGCPNNCVFCNQRRISGAQEPATAETVTAALKAADRIKADNGNWELAFYGGSFTAIPADRQQELLGAASEFVKSGGVLRISTRPDCISKEALMRLEAFGVKTIELGCQSMDEEVLKKSGRGHTAEDTVNAVKLIKEHEFDLILQMMTGLPGDTLERSAYTAERLSKLNPDGVRIYPTVIIRDTPLFDMWQNGAYREHTVEEAVRWCAELVPIFEYNDIPIIRLGLNPTEDLSGGSAVGGAYHPAFGELVMSKIYLNRAQELLKGIKSGKAAGFCVNPGCVSIMAGHKKCNSIALKAQYHFSNIVIKTDAALKKGEIKLLYVEK